METLLSFFGRKKTPFTAAPPIQNNSFSQVNPKYSNVESALAKADKLSLEVVKNYKHRNTKKLNSNIRQLKNLVNAKYIGKDYFDRRFSRNSASMSELDDEELGYIKYMMERDGVFNSFKGGKRGKTRRRKARKSKTRRH